MHCPVCNYKSTRVVDSRLATGGMQVRRRRECERARCGYRFSTVEEAELLDISIVKRGGYHEPYRRDKLVTGLKKALEKRPCTDAQLHNLVQRIERDIQKKRTGEMTSIDLGEILMRHLRRFDKVAYIRFASVYYSFEDLKTFEDELKKLSHKRRKKS